MSEGHAAAVSLSQRLPLPFYSTKFSSVQASRARALQVSFAPIESHGPLFSTSSFVDRPPLHHPAPFPQTAFLMLAFAY